MNIPVIDGVSYTKEFVSELKESTITVRDAALEHDRLDWALALSHIITCLSLLIEELPQ